MNEGQCSHLALMAFRAVGFSLLLTLACQEVLSTFTVVGLGCMGSGSLEIDLPASPNNNENKNDDHGLGLTMWFSQALGQRDE